MPRKLTRVLVCKAFYNELEAALERHDYVRADELMHQDAALRIRASAKDLEVYAEQAPGWLHPTYQMLCYAHGRAIP